MESPSTTSFKCLLAGFDTLQAAYYLVPSLDSEFDFSQLMLRRDQLRADKSRRGASVTIGGWELRLKPHGSGSGYPLILEHPHYTLECGQFNKPSFFVTFRSEALWLIGAESLHETFVTWAESVGLRTMMAESISRADFAFDYRLADVGFTEEHFVSVSAKDATYREDGRIQTIAFGKGDVVLRVYDKVTEIAQQSDKVWLFQLWGEKENVWRIEWQARKAVLRRFGLRTFADLFAGYGDLLRYLATEHDSLRVPSGDSNRSRWPLHSLWLDVLREIDAFPAQGVYREVDEQAVLSVREQRVAISVYGYLKRLAALIEVGRDEGQVSLTDAQTRLQTLVRRLHDPLSWRIDVAAKRDQIRLGR